MFSLRLDLDFLLHDDSLIDILDQLIDEIQKNDFHGCFFFVDSYVWVKTSSRGRVRTALPYSQELSLDILVVFRNDIYVWNNGHCVDERYLPRTV